MPQQQDMMRQFSQMSIGPMRYSEGQFGNPEAMAQMAAMGGIPVNPISSQLTPKKLKGDKITAKNKAAVMKAVMKNEKLMAKALPWIQKGIVPPFVKLNKPKPKPAPKPPPPAPKKPPPAWPTMKELKRLTTEETENVLKNLPSLEGVERVERKELEPGERPMASAVDSIIQAKKVANKMLEYKAKAEQKEQQKDMKQNLIDEFGKEEYDRKMELMKKMQKEKEAAKAAKAARKKMRKIAKVAAAAEAFKAEMEAARPKTPAFLEEDAPGEDGNTVSLEGTSTRASGLFFQKAMESNYLGLRAHKNIIPK